MSGVVLAMEGFNSIYILRRDIAVVLRDPINID
jgi:hypothetical protein